MKIKKKSYTIIGTVKQGQKKGDLTGLHTANLDVALAQNLPKGLYSCIVKLNKKIYSGLLYYGHNSLSKQDCLEVHIANFTSNIYGQEIVIKIKKYLRSEKKFNSIETLKEQLKKDKKWLLPN